MRARKISMIYIDIHLELIRYELQGVTIYQHSSNSNKVLGGSASDYPHQTMLQFSKTNNSTILLTLCSHLPDGGVCRCKRKTDRENKVEYRT